MVLPADAWVWSREPSTAELCRRAEEVVADARATVAQTRRIVEECWQTLHRCRWSNEQRPPFLDNPFDLPLEHG